MHIWQLCVLAYPVFHPKRAVDFTGPAGPFTDVSVQLRDDTGQISWGKAAEVARALCAAMQCPFSVLDDYDITRYAGRTNPDAG
jgi:hypothetical protein